MKDGGLIGFERIDWFNGGLFDDDQALPLTADDIAICLRAASARLERNGSLDLRNAVRARS